MKNTPLAVFQPLISSTVIRDSITRSVFKLNVTKVRQESSRIHAPACLPVRAARRQVQTRLRRPARAKGRREAGRRQTGGDELLIASEASQPSALGT